MGTILSAALRVMGAGILASLAVHGEWQTAPQPKFQVEIQAAAEKGPRYTVTNLTGKTVTACVLELFSTSDSEQKSRTVWDALLQGELPIEPGASISQYLSHVVGGPLPDKVEVVAGVWADGETFGQPNWVKVILKNREILASAYEQAGALLQRGLDQNWTRDQYLAALNSKPNSAPVNSIRRTLEANAKSDHDPQSLHLAMRDLLAYFTHNLALIRQAQRPEGVPTNH